LPAVIKAGMIIRGGGVASEAQEIKPPPPLYPEGFIPPEEAHRQAQDILAQAAESAGRLQQQAQQMGYEEGHNRGFAAGRQAAVDAWSALLNTFKQNIEGILAQRQQILAAAEPDIVRLVLLAAAKVLHRESRHPDLAAHLIARTLPRASDGTVVKIRLNPADHARLAELPGLPAGMAACEVVADPNVGAGGCLVECHLCTIDATFRTLFEEVARELMRDEPERDLIVAREIAELAKAPEIEATVPAAVADAGPDPDPDPAAGPDFEMPGL
jgi:flagellar assembly protein FliH